MPTLPATLRIQRLPHNPDLPLPAYKTAGAAGMDLVAAESATLQPLDRRAIATGLIIAVPEGFEAQVRPRSGLALRHGLSMPNSPGTIDSDYRGELKVLVINLGREPLHIERGMRIAQLIIAPVAHATIQVVDVMDDTARGEHGFGSTGV
jgi:dUTP pyrophosphatase